MVTREFINGDLALDDVETLGNLYECPPFREEATDHSRIQCEVLLQVTRKGNRLFCLAMLEGTDQLAMRHHRVFCLVST